MFCLHFLLLSHSHCCKHSDVSVSARTFIEYVLMFAGKFDSLVPIGSHLVCIDCWQASTRIAFRFYRFFAHYFLNNNLSSKSFAHTHARCFIRLSFRLVSFYAILCVLSRFFCRFSISCFGAFCISKLLLPL